jgi:uncharacterized protein YkwD
LLALFYLGAAPGQIAAQSGESLGSNPYTQSPNLAQVSNLIVVRSNALRNAQSLPPTQISAPLTRAAQYFAEFMARTDQHGHEVDGATPAARAQQHGYNFCMVAENIAYQFDSSGFATEELARRLVEGWKNSPGHRKNMLDPQAMETGTAVARSARTGRYYAVQMFGRPKSAMIEFQIANLSTGPERYQLGEQVYEIPVRGTRTHGQCRPAQIGVLGASEEGRVIVQPANRDRYAIVRDHLGLRLLKQ